MKHVFFLLILAGPLRAELLATFQTSKGNVTAALRYEEAPQAVANFITLAQGTRVRVDPLTGALTHQPLYAGEKFFHVINDPGLKIARTGSGTGTDSGGPGYTFRDEFDPGLTHVPYVLSMENNGVHTNGSRISLTGNVPLPARDNVNTVFGLITDAGSRAVVDTILAAGSDGTTITAVTFARTDPAAVAFDEFSQELPECQPVPGNLAVAPGTSADYVFKAPLKPGTIFQSYRSTDLATWSKLAERYHGTGQAGFSSMTLDTAALPRAFYHISMVVYQDALAPESHAGRQLLVGLFGTQTLLFNFDATGLSGSVVYSQSAQSYPFTLTGYTKSPYKATWEFNVNTLGPLRVRGILNSQKELHVLGTHEIDQSNGTIWLPLSSGGLSVTK